MPIDGGTESDRTSMLPERWARLQSTFEQAVSLSPGEREAFLARCRDVDARLADEVEALVRAGGEAGAFIEEAIARAVGR